MCLVPSVTLNNGVQIPQIGLGVWQVPVDQVASVVLEAIDVGYRCIDTAAMYENEVGVGEAIARTDVPRSELFISTKVWNRDQGYEKTRAAFELSRKKLGLEYLDLYMIHWPVASQGLFEETWAAMEALYTQGLVRAIAVANFRLPDLQQILTSGSVPPVLNQIEMHPGLQQRELRAFHGEHGIRTQAWSPLGHGSAISDPVIQEIAARHGVSAPQVILRWHIQRDALVIPKTVNRDRMVENLSLFDFTLSDDDVAAIAELDRNQRTGPDPDTFVGTRTVSPMPA